MDKFATRSVTTCSPLAAAQINRCWHCWMDIAHGSNGNIFLSLSFPAPFLRHKSLLVFLRSATCVFLTGSLLCLCFFQYTLYMSVHLCLPGRSRTYRSRGRINFPSFSFHERILCERSTFRKSTLRCYIQVSPLLPSTVHTQ